MDAWTKLSAKVNWHGPMEIAAVHSGCLTSSGLPEDIRTEHGVWDRCGGFIGGVRLCELPEMVQSGLLFSCVCPQVKAAVGVSTAILKSDLGDVSFHPSTSSTPRC